MTRPTTPSEMADHAQIVELESQVDRLQAVLHCASYLLALNDGPRDSYYETNKSAAWEQLREAVTKADDAWLAKERAARDLAEHRSMTLDEASEALRAER